MCKSRGDSISDVKIGTPGAGVAGVEDVIYEVYIDRYARTIR